MIGLSSFARSRHWGVGALISIAAAIAVYACGPISYSLNPESGYLVAVAAQIPIVPAVAIQATLVNTSLQQSERLAHRNLAPLRVAHILILTAFAAASIAVTAAYLINAPGTIASSAHIRGLGPLGLVRNTIALTGAAVIAGYVLGARFGWILPLGWSLIPATLTAPTRDSWRIATLLGQPDSALLPLLFALALWLGGIALAATRRGGQEWIFSPTIRRPRASTRNSLS